MSGGNFITQNKVRPGAYINFKSSPKNSLGVGDRGIATIPLALKWGPKKEVIKVNVQTNFVKSLGYDLASSELLLIKECLKRAKEVLIYRLAGGTKATKTASNLTITARYEGSRGNAITVKILANADISGQFIVTTYLDGVEMDEQFASQVSDLEANEFVVFSGSGNLVESSGLILTGGTDTAPVTQDYLDYFTAIEVEKFSTMAVPTTDSTILAAVKSFVSKMRNDEGVKIQAVVPDYASADDEGIISVKNGVILKDGTTIDKTKAVAFIAGKTASSAINESNTYAAYDDAVDVDTKYTNSQIISALNSGEMLFTLINNKVVIEQDINTLTTFTSSKGNEFRKNRVIRTIDEIGNTVSQIYKVKYIGKIDNNDTGRALFKGDIINYLTELNKLNAIQNFDASTDVEVIAGNDIDAVVANIAIQPVDSMEKLYMTVTLV